MLKLFLILYGLLQVQSAIEPCTMTEEDDNSNCIGCNEEAKRNIATDPPQQQQCCPGYSGSECLPICDLHCETNQECSSPNTCTCIDGWTGSNCETLKCSPSCGTNKECTSPNTCTCVDGWTESNCDIAICDSCDSINQQCLIPGDCTCVEGWTGSNCEIAICAQSCGTNKECSSPDTCTCVSGWTGADCLIAICNPPCGTNQECSLPNTCTCVKGWKDNNCLSDINECNEGTHLCEETCENTNGSYICICNDKNRILANDKMNCLGGINDIYGIPKINSITLIWSPPTNYTEYGDFSGYNIKCSVNLPDSIVVINKFIMFSNSHYTATSLDPFTQYKCCIEPHWTTNGVGPTVCIEQMTLEDAPDDFPQNISIIAADSVSVLILWQPPHIPNGIITHYNIYIDFTNGTNITTNSVLGDSTLYLLDQLSIFQLVGVSISAITGGGEGPMSSYVFNTSAETEPGPVHHLAIDIISNTSANISWHPPVSLNGVIISYHIVIRNLTHNISMSDWILESSDRHYIIDDLEPFVPYEVDVVAETKAGKGNLTQKLFFTVQSVPFLAPSWSIVHRESATEVQLQWTGLSLATSRGYIAEYNIKYAQSINSTCLFTENVTHIQTQDKELMLTELNPKYEYCVSIAASTEIGIGIFSQWTLVEVFGKKINLYVLISGVQNCTQWIQSNKVNKLKAVSSTVITQLHQSCQCHVTEDFIQSIVMLPCVTEGSVVVKITITLIKGYTGEEMLMFLKKWSDTVPTIKMDGLVLSIESVCNSSDCLLVTSSTVQLVTPSMINTIKEPASSTQFPLMPITVTVSIVVVIVLIIIIIVTTVTLLRMKRSRGFKCTDEQVENQENQIPSSIYNPHYEAQLVSLQKVAPMTNKSTMYDSCSSQKKANSDTTCSTISQKTHVTSSVDVPTENHIDDGMIGNGNVATTDESDYEN